jgi:molecular chaperone GrpE
VFENMTRYPYLPFFEDRPPNGPDAVPPEPAESAVEPGQEPPADENRPEDLPSGTLEAAAIQDGVQSIPASEGAEPARLDRMSTALSAWKENLRRDFEAWLASVGEIPDSAAAEAPDENPDLYSFYEQLTAANAEFRKTNRRTAEAFGQWGEALARFDEEMKSVRNLLGRLSAGQDNEAALSRGHCLALVELLDRMQRIALAFQSPPAKTWWSRDEAWRRVWENQRHAFEILIEHFRELLEKEGVRPIETIGRPFDPTVMSAAAVQADPERIHNTVIEEFAAGYFRHGELLRAAQVKVIINKSGAQNPWVN